MDWEREYKAEAPSNRVARMIEFEIAKRRLLWACRRYHPMCRMAHKIVKWLAGILTPGGK